MISPARSYCTSQTKNSLATNFMKRTLSLLCLCFVINVSCSKVIGQDVAFRKRILQIKDTVNAKVGVAIIDLNSLDTLTLDNTSHFTMQSVFKFPLALTVLHLIDLKKLSLAQKVHITKEDYIPNTWSQIAKEHAEGNVELTLEELLMYTISKGDNNTCDILFRLVGSPLAIQKYVHDIGVKDIAIVANEEEMHKSWDVQYSNWSTPIAMAELLRLAFKTDILSRNSRDFLWNAMVATMTGSKRIKGLLPSDVTVAHRTGGSSTSEEGITPATNDVGIISMPNGKQLVVVVFVSDSKEKGEKNEKVIAEISKASYDYFAN
jgi:beta-lactamase class A